ncbi:hypothetical protein like AT4G29110 [Hibiscus trionum]|uniref:Avr9/Cf-9 rapidly elicited protein n=1 Tax=Hibiscus trionum TaxID=183268 RepID=A0A9W7I328_HIBTR|nr:hypothetical protein like AT4G29110 [Hibiscus trionum]
METSASVVAKKPWNIVRIVLFMLKTGISKSKILVHLHFMIKKGKHNAAKAISNLAFHHHFSSFGCRSDDALSFVSPREYEFSCSNTPAFHHHKRQRKHHHHHYYKSSYRYDDVTTVAAVQKVLEMLNNEAESASPMVLPGFGRSPLGRQLRVTDSPFPLKDDGDSQVDMAAEEFINKFYRDLKLQKGMSAFDSPAHNTWGRW